MLLAVKFLRLLLVIGLLAAPALAETIRVPFFIGKGQRVVYIEALVGGDVRRFIVDTGAHATHVRPEIVGITLKERSHLGDGSVGFVGGARRIENFEIKLAGHSYIFTAMASDMKVVRQSYTNIDGLLGQDFLSLFTRVTFDYKNHELLLER
jgi:hypothetical protein